MCDADESICLCHLNDDELCFLYMVVVELMLCSSVGVFISFVPT